MTLVLTVALVTAAAVGALVALVAVGACRLNARNRHATPPDRDDGRQLRTNSGGSR